MSDCCIFIHSIKVGKFLLALDRNCVLKNEYVIMCLPILGEICHIGVFNSAIVVSCLFHKMHFPICSSIIL